MKMSHWLPAIGALMATAACASGPTSFTEVAPREAYTAGTPNLYGSSIGSSVKQCTPIDDTFSHITVATTSNQPGMSAVVPLMNFSYLGDANCQLLRDGSGMPIKATPEQALQASDIRAQMVAAGFGIAQTAANGVLSTAINAATNDCPNGNCQVGAPSIIVQQQTGVTSTSGTTVDIGGCGTGVCGQSPD